MISNKTVSKVIDFEPKSQYNNVSNKTNVKFDITR